MLGGNAKVTSVQDNQDKGPLLTREDSRFVYEYTRAQQI